MKLKLILNEENYGIENAVVIGDIKKWIEKDDYNELTLDDGINCNVVYIFEVIVDKDINLNLKDVIIDYVYDDNGNQLSYEITKDHIDIASQHFENIKSNFIEKVKYLIRS